MESLASIFFSPWGAFFAAFGERSPLHLVGWDLPRVGKTGQAAVIS